MSFTHVHHELVTRLDQADRGDRGWFIVTRVHVSAIWLKGIAKYLKTQGGTGIIKLSRTHFDDIAKITDVQSNDPKVQLKRHHLLVMDTPLQLIQRINNSRWDEIKLTAYGHELARSANATEAADVLERSLLDITFAVEPWATSGRSKRYSGFNLQVYQITQDVLIRCNKYIDRDEFDLFVSRMRNIGELNWTVDQILKFRTLAPDQKNLLLNEVRNRISGNKSYQNWRDQALHTFTLFSLGTSMERKNQQLYLT